MVSPHTATMLPYVLCELRGLRDAADARAAADTRAAAYPRRRYPADHEDDDIDLDTLIGALLSAAPRRTQPSLTRAASRARQQQQQQQQRQDAADKKDALAIHLDVQQFLPEELSVRVDKERGCVVVEAAHEERPDGHGFVRRQFTRRYPLPADVDPDAVVSRLSADGVLRVSAPRREAPPADANVRRVPIQLSDRPAVRVEDAVQGKEAIKEDAVQKEAVKDINDVVQVKKAGDGEAKANTA